MVVFTIILECIFLIAYAITAFKGSTRAYYWLVVAILVVLTTLMQQQQEVIWLLKKLTP